MRAPAALAGFLFSLLIIGCGVREQYGLLSNNKGEMCYNVPATPTEEYFIDVGPGLLVVLPAETATPVPPPPPPPVSAGRYVYITFYCCEGQGCGYCGTTASGIQVQPGVAACGSNYAMGTKFMIDADPTGRVYECLDRGWLAPNQVDIFFYTREEGYQWSAQVGMEGTIRLLE